MALIHSNEPHRDRSQKYLYYNQTNIDGTPVITNDATVGIGTTVVARALVTPTGIPYMYDSGDVTTGITSISYIMDSNGSWASFSTMQTKDLELQEYPGYSMSLTGNFLLLGCPGYDPNRAEPTNIYGVLGGLYDGQSPGSGFPYPVGPNYSYFGTPGTWVYKWMWKQESLWAQHGRAYAYNFHMPQSFNPNFGIAGLSINTVVSQEYNLTSNTGQRRRYLPQTTGAVPPTSLVGEDSLYIREPGQTSIASTSEAGYQVRTWYAPQPEMMRSSSMSNIRCGHSVSYSAGIFAFGAPGTVGYATTDPVTIAELDPTNNAANGGPGPWDGYGRVVIARYPKSQSTNTLIYSDGDEEGSFQMPGDGSRRSQHLFLGAHTSDLWQITPPEVWDYTESNVSGMRTSSAVSPEQYDKFGWSVCTKYRRIIVGAPDGNNGTGKAYLYNDKAELIKELTPVGTAKSFGYSVSMGSGRIAIGEPGGDTGTGSCYIYDLEGCLVGILTAPDGKPGDQFGHSVCIRSGIVAVGAPNANVSIGNSFSRCGAVYGFNRDRVSQIHQTPIPGYMGSNGKPVNPSLVFKTFPIDGEDGDRFGHSVAVGAGRVIVGAPYKYNPDINHDNFRAVPDVVSQVNEARDGAAYVYNLGGGFIQKTVGTSPDSHYGWAVAVDGHMVAISAPMHRHEYYWYPPENGRYAQLNWDFYENEDYSITFNGVNIPTMISRSLFAGETGTGEVFDIVAGTWRGLYWTNSNGDTDYSNPNLIEGSEIPINSFMKHAFPSPGIFVYYTPSVVTLYDAIDFKYE